MAIEKMCEGIGLLSRVEARALLDALAPQGYDEDFKIFHKALKDLEPGDNTAFRMEYYTTILAVWRLLFMVAHERVPNDDELAEI